jgi:hypothetical protein
MVGLDGDMVGLDGNMVGLDGDTDLTGNIRSCCTYRP